MPIDGFFLAIGHQPNSDIFKDYLDTDEVGYIITVIPAELWLDEIEAY